MPTRRSINRLTDKSKNPSRAFTLIELMLVMAIMGLMGTISVGGYRAMRRGMEQSGVMRNVNQFIRNAYQRAQIDRVPVTVYFWNETQREASDYESLIVVGRAVAVRQIGRVSYFSSGNSIIVDEFGDLKYQKGTDSEGEESSESAAEEQSEKSMSMKLYKMDGQSGWDGVSIVGVSTLKANQMIEVGQMLSDPDWQGVNTSGSTSGSKSKDNQEAVVAYGYKIQSASGYNSTWKVGDAYGTEFAEVTLPNNYIFGGSSDYSKDAGNPIKRLGTVLDFKPGESPSGNITVSALRGEKGGSGAAKAHTVGTSQSPTEKIK